MKTLQTRLARFNGMLKASLAKVVGDRDVLTRAGELVLVAVLIVPAFVAVVVFGR